jgi:hypothetical protein
MLRIIGHTSNCIGELEVDDYVPLAFRAHPALRPDPLLWRTGDLKSTLLEIKVDRTTGELFSVTLVTFEGTLSPGKYPIDSNTQIVRGLPVVSVTELGGAVSDERQTLVLLQDHNQISVHFHSLVKANECYKVDRVSFLARDGILVGLSFDDLTPMEIEIIKGARGEA